MIKFGQTLVEIMYICYFSCEISKFVKSHLQCWLDPMQLKLPMINLSHLGFFGARFISSCYAFPLGVVGGYAWSLDHANVHFL